MCSMERSLGSSLRTNHSSTESPTCAKDSKTQHQNTAPRTDVRKSYWGSGACLALAGALYLCALMAGPALALADASAALNQRETGLGPEDDADSFVPGPKNTADLNSMRQQMLQSAPVTFLDHVQTLSGKSPPLRRKRRKRPGDVDTSDFRSG